MNLITKIAIVVLVVAALINAAVTIKMATEPVNWRTKCEQAQAVNAQLEQTARQHALREGKLNSDLTVNRAMSTAEQVSLRKNIDRLEADNIALRKQLDDNIQKVVGLTAEITNSNGIAKTAEARAKRQEEDAAKLREEIKLKDNDARNVEQALALARADLERSEKVNRVLREMLDARDRQIKELERQLIIIKSNLSGTDVGDSPAGVRPAKVNGVISVVDAASNMASINIGATQGVATGMKLMIYRGGDFVGYLEIVQVSQTDAAGKIVDQQLPPAKGDCVTNNLN